MSDRDDTRLEHHRVAIATAEHAWRKSQQGERKAKERRDRAIRRAHKAGYGYGTIAKWLDEEGYDVTRALIYHICRED